MATYSGSIDVMSQVDAVIRIEWWQEFFGFTAR